MKAWRTILLPLLISLVLFAPAHSRDKFYRVKRVVDGDTLLLTNGERPWAVEEGEEETRIPEIRAKLLEKYGTTDGVLFCVIKRQGTGKGREAQPQRTKGPR